MNTPVYLAEPTEEDVLNVLKAAGTQTGLIDRDVKEVTRLSEQAFQVAIAAGDLILRFPKDAAGLALLEKEERVQRELRERVVLLLPDTCVYAALPGLPAFGVHHMIPGGPLTTDLYTDLSPAARDRLVFDLSTFFDQTHRVPLAQACAWLGRSSEENSPEVLVSVYGRPGWFGGAAAIELRKSLAQALTLDELNQLEETIHQFEELESRFIDLVFGHGDLHGYNVAMGLDRLGPRLVGVFDLGCTGILDIHEDFFRLSLVSEDLLERVLDYYHGMNQARQLERQRIAVYYRAFLFYLMGEQAGSSLAHLKHLLSKHIRYFQSR
jgi:hypothetical protein